MRYLVLLQGLLGNACARADVNMSTLTTPFDGWLTCPSRQLVNWNSKLLSSRKLWQPSGLDILWSAPIHSPWLRLFWLTWDLSFFFTIHLHVRLEAVSSCAVSPHLLTAHNPILKSYTFA